jgi:hypothetical protein
MGQAIGTPEFLWLGRVFGWRVRPSHSLAAAFVLLACWIGLTAEKVGAAECPLGRANAGLINAAGYAASELLILTAHAPFEIAAETPCLFQLVQAASSEFLVGDIVGPSGQTIPMSINVPMDVALPDRGKTFLMFRGLPEAVQLTAGFKMRNAWAVSWRDINGVSLVAKPGYEGSFRLEVLFYRGPDLPPLQQVATVNIRPPDRREARAGPVSPGAIPIPPSGRIANTATIAQEPPRVPPATSLSSSQESAMLANGRNFVLSGNLATARFVFEDLAAKGSGAGAFAMAQTFDPQFLKSVIVVGPQQANLAEARKWYRVAAERGHGEAQDRLRALESGQP